MSAWFIIGTFSFLCICFDCAKRISCAFTVTTAIKSDKAGEEADVNIEATTSGLCNSKPNTGVNEPTQSDDLSDLGGTCVKSEANASSTSNDDSNLTKRKLASQNGIALEVFVGGMI